MATGGGLEIHVEMFHAPPPAELSLNPEGLDAEAQSDGEPVPVLAAALPARPAMPRERPMLRGYDPTVPLTAVLVLTMLIAALGAAVHRSANPSHAAVASLAAGVTPTTLVPVAQPPATPAPSSGGSPAAIPPAGSQSPTAAQPLTWDQQCEQLVDSLSNRTSRRSVDIAGLVRSNTFPALPLPGFETPQVASVGHWGTAQEYLASGIGPSDVTASRWQQLLIGNGFVAADDVEFFDNGSSYGVGVLQFTSAAGARAFNKATLLTACTSGILENPKVMPSLAGGMNYRIVSDGPPFRASFVAGDTVVRLHLCHCVQAPDDQALAGQWAQAVASHVGAS
jgi:hypothetical protein